ncbi:hypothetical protein ABEB36_003902 [Hypothenemus hampei]|uniref:Uncharacterized protein n=1 Tax=Hypothenemus hampei TaxID=57062 RepID=A0ABD1F1H9_HYPHA
MDVAYEENRHCRDVRKVGFATTEGDSESSNQGCFLQPPQLVITDVEHQDGNSSALSSRRASIISALRRPSQAIALSVAQSVMNQRRHLLEMFNSSTQNLRKDQENRMSRITDNNDFTIILSALYAKLLVVLGIAFPITQVISDKVHLFYYQGFYLFLYLGSIAFITYEYVSFVKERAIKEVIKNMKDDFAKELDPNEDLVERGNYSSKPAKKYGSFFLRLGAIAFGIGSMVYSGLEFGRYFELKTAENCDYSTLQAITPATRLILTLLQVQFIFLNHKDVELNRHKIIGRFGLMHLIATNLCEWLCVLVEETKHEIVHLSVHKAENLSNVSLPVGYYCSGHLMSSLVNNASPFLFPCTIEYSLICAVILFEMWKHIRVEDKFDKNRANKKNKHRSEELAHFASSSHHFTIDCSNSHKGLFAGIMVIVLTIISLVMFFVLTAQKDEYSNRKHYAELEVNVVELLLYIATTIAAVLAMCQLRKLKYEKKFSQMGIGLDNTLLTVAQTGMFIYSTFSIIGWYFTMENETPVGLVADIFAFIQTSLQTMFVLDAWWRRCKNISQARTKPGRELIIFLMIANMAMWSVNTLEKNRAEFRPTHLKFFGAWAWTVITHISMPLAIFYRFHSTICLFEIWKTAYKIKSNFKNPLFPVM